MLEKLSVVFISLSCALAHAQNPGGTWLKYQTPEDAGFSTVKLERAKAFYNSTPAKAVMIVSHGSVVAAWGDVERRYKCHSMRKSLLNSLFGIYVQRGMIDINQNLGVLGINDKIELTETEKTAKVSDLLKTRSGVYLPAALEEKNTSRPKRGSHPPGTFQYYNNWDFNVLGSIFVKATKQDIFEAFKRDIADPLGMQDFRIMDGACEYEENSIHPGYPFKMSARDLARFGQLYLQNGRWNNKPIIDEKWIAATSTPYTSATNMATAPPAMDTSGGYRIDRANREGTLRSAGGNNISEYFRT